MNRSKTVSLHKQFYLRTMLLLVVIIVSEALLSGCQPNSQSTSGPGPRLEAAAQTTEGTQTSAPTQSPEATQTPAPTQTFGPLQEAEPAELLIGAAASLQASLEQLQENYEKQYPNTKLIFTFAGSGTLEQQIRAGALMDIFISAAEKQMNALEADSFLLEGSRVKLLENQIALIVPKDNPLRITGFEDVVKAKVIAVGDPASVPAGQYAQEIYTGIGIWEEVLKKATLAKDVTEVLTWVSSGNADVGVVYTTDAALSDDVIVAALAPDGSHKQVIYPAAVLKESIQQEAAGEFIRFLQSQEARDIFESYGFKIPEE